MWALPLVLCPCPLLRYLLLRALFLMCMYVGRGVKGPVNYSQLFVLTFMFPVSDLHGARVLPVLVLVEHPGGGGIFKLCRRKGTA